MGWVSPSLLVLQAPDSPLGAPLTDSESAWVASVLCIGALVGTPVFGLLGDKLGRRWAGLLIAVPYTVSKNDIWAVCLSLHCKYRDFWAVCLKL